MQAKGILPGMWSAHAGTVGAAIVTTLLLAACSDSDGPNRSNVATATNTVPTIDGAPVATTLGEGESFSFTPTADDADNDTLSFSVTNAPSWASFDSTTGTLSGTPSLSDAGAYTDIVISVSDGESEASLPAFDLSVFDVTALTLTGVITDGPIANAEVTVTFGGESFTAQADENGAYVLDVRIASDTADPHALVEIVGKGVGVQAGVELISQVGALGSLASAAGDDATLASDEEPRLTVSHVSTARFLLAMDVNGGKVPDTEDELFGAEGAIDGDELLETAAIIKLIVDEGLIAVSDDMSTLDLLRAPSSATTNADTILTALTDAGLTDGDGQLVESVQASLQTAIADTLADDALKVAFLAQQVQGSAIWQEPTRPEWVTFRGTVAEFDADGTGTEYARSFTFVSGPVEGTDITLPRAEFTWSIDASGDLIVDYDDNTGTTFFFIDPASLVDNYGFDQAAADFLQDAIDDGRYQQTQEALTLTLESSRNQLLLRSPRQMLVRQTRNSFYALDDMFTRLGWVGALPRGNLVEESNRVLLDVEALGSADGFAQAGDSWALEQVYQPTDSRVQGVATALAHDLFTLQQDGSTTPGELGNDIFTWRIGTDGELVLENTEATYTYRRVATMGEIDLHLVSMDLGNQQWSTAVWGAKQMPGGEALAGI